MSGDGCERSMKGRSDASLGTQQAAVFGSAALLRVDPLGDEGLRSGASRGGIDELRVAVVYRCREHDHSRTMLDLITLPDQDDRIAIADGLAAKVPVKEIAAGIAKSFQTVYREIARGSKPDGRYQPWWAHNQALLRRQRPKRNGSSPAPRCGRRSPTSSVEVVTTTDLAVLEAGVPA